MGTGLLRLNIQTDAQRFATKDLELEYLGDSFPESLLQMLTRYGEWLLTPTLTHYPKPSQIRYGGFT